MKALLTSGGISNQTIEAEMWRLLGGQRTGVKLLFCTTASNYEGGNMSDWLVEDIIRFKDLGFEIDVCDISGITKENFLPRFEWADMFYFEGGNTQWLRKCIKDSGLEAELPRLLETKIWSGASAGSCVLSPTVTNSCQDLFDENLPGYPSDGLGLVDFQFIPHLNNTYFPKVTAKNLETAARNLQKLDGKKLYICDDEGAISIDGDHVKIVSEGEVIEREVA
ncbi:peptidase E [Candidatus Saccharibacteria bacterium]|nr:peptidase E [Candidatus Saccharibacteria bacterium]